MSTEPTIKRTGGCLCGDVRYEIRGSLRNVVLSLEALHDLAGTLSDAPLDATHAAFAAALKRAGSLDDPTFSNVTDPQARFYVEALQQTLRGVQEAVGNEIGQSLGVAAGFNALDGD